MAEAVAEYVKRGYQTLSVNGARRVMIKNPEQMLAPMTELLRVGFLHVEAREID
jgi:hypothetical protein